MLKKILQNSYLLKYTRALLFYFNKFAIQCKNMAFLSYDVSSQFIHSGFCLFSKVWNQEETKDSKEEGEGGEEEKAGRRARKKEAISGSRYTSGESSFTHI